MTSQSTNSNVETISIVEPINQYTALAVRVIFFLTIKKKMYIFFLFRVELFALVY